jgi:hypothetical protein
VLVWNSRVGEPTQTQPRDESHELIESVP